MVSRSGSRRGGRPTSRARRWVRSRGISIFTGQTSAHAPQREDAYGREGVVLDALELGRQDRADRARDTPSRTRDRPRARTPGTRSGTRCSGCSAAPGARPRPRAFERGRCRGGRGGTRAVPSPSRAPRRSTPTCTGSAARPWTTAAAAAGTPPCHASGHHLLDPHHRDEHLRQRRAHPAVALGLEHADAARLRHREVRPAHPHARRQELRPQVKPRRLGERRGVVGQLVEPSSRRKMSRISARLRWIAGTRMCEGKSSSSWMISSARSVSSAWIPAAARLLVEVDLVGGDRLDLHHLVHPVGPGNGGDDRAGFKPSFAQWTCPPAAVTATRARSGGRRATAAPRP